jgi:pilus assembly protein CpaC
VPVFGVVTLVGARFMVHDKHHLKWWLRFFCAVCWLSFLIHHGTVRAGGQEGSRPAYVFPPQAGAVAAEAPAAVRATTGDELPVESRVLRNGGAVASGQRQPRLPRGASGREVLASSGDGWREHVEFEVEADSTLTLSVNRPRLLRLKSPPLRTFLPEAGANVIALRHVDPETGCQLAIEPVATGTTTLTLWFRDEAAESGEQAVSWIVRVVEDPDEGRWEEQLLERLEQEVNRAFPNSVVQLSWVGRQVVLRGQARDAEEAAQIVRVVSSGLPETNISGESEERVPAADVEQLSAGPLAGVLAGSAASGVNQQQANGRVVNLLEVAGVHQVMLKVTVAEVNRSATRAVGTSLEIGGTDGAARFFTSLGTPAGAGSMVFNRGDFDIAIRALKELNLAKSLAEPTLTTLNGQMATFNAGGSFPVPVVTGATSTGLQGVEFQNFGVQLSVLPTVTDYDRIRLNMIASVTTRDESAGTEFGTAAVPGLNARTVQNTVELREGQTLAIAGLIQNNLGGKSRRVPFAGDVPIVGRLFSNDATSWDEQELIVLVTPWLVSPLGREQTGPSLPGGDYFEPDDIEFFLKGSLTGHIPEDYRSAVRTDLQKMKAFRRVEQQLILGRPGHSNGLLCPDPRQPVVIPSASLAPTAGH